MEKIEEGYSDKIIKGIIQSVELGKEAGYIDTIPEIGEPEGILIRGYCNTKPDFVNRIDERLWVEYWNLTGEPSEISYTLNKEDKVFPTLFKKEIGKVDYSEVVSSIKLINILLREHHKSTLKYNNEIAQPYIEERSKLINKIIQI